MRGARVGGGREEVTFRIHYNTRGQEANKELFWDSL
jgi:hypothetical protein